MAVVVKTGDGSCCCGSGSAESCWCNASSEPESLPVCLTVASDLAFDFYGERTSYTFGGVMEPTTFGGVTVYTYDEVLEDDDGNDLRVFASLRCTAGGYRMYFNVYYNHAADFDDWTAAFATEGYVIEWQCPEGCADYTASAELITWFGGSGSGPAEVTVRAQVGDCYSACGSGQSGTSGGLSGSDAVPPGGAPADCPHPGTYCVTSAAFDCAPSGLLVEVSEDAGEPGEFSGTSEDPDVIATLDTSAQPELLGLSAVTSTGVATALYECSAFDCETGGEFDLIGGDAGCGWPAAVTVTGGPCTSAGGSELPPP